MPRKAKSKAQARLFGAVRGGKAKVKGLSKRKAGEMLKGTKMSKLPARVKKGRGKKKG